MVAASPADNDADALAMLFSAPTTIVTHSVVIADQQADTMDPLDYCRQKVAAPGTDLYYALRFSTPAQRPGLLAVHAFMEEVIAVAHQVSDRGVAATKLNWWREELERAIVGQGRHPVSQLLTPAMERHALAPAGLRDMLEGAAMDLEYGLYPAFSQLSIYGHRTSGSLAQLVVKICGHREQETIRYGHDLGMGLGLFALLRDLRLHIDRGHCYIPEDELARTGLAVEDLRPQGPSGPSGPSGQDHSKREAIRGLLREQAVRVEGFFTEAEQRLPGGDRPAQRFGLIRMALARKLLAEMAAEDYPLLERGFELTPIRKLWIAWRTARHNRREP